MRSHLTLKEQFEGFPVYQVTIVCIMRFAESLAHTQIFQYQFHMIRKFHIAPTESDIFKYNGYLMAVYSISQTMANIFWSKKSDKWGRKTVLLLGLIGNAVSMLVYGFSGTFYVAMISKVIGGLTNANASITRTVLGEIAPDRKYNFLSFATFPLFWNLGSIIGPLIGANLKTSHEWPGKNHQAESSSSKRGSSSYLNKQGFHLFKRETLALLKTYPFALPNIVAAIILVISAIIVALFLEETLKKKRNSKDRALKFGDSIRTKLGFKVPERNWILQKYSLINEENRVLTENMDSESEEYESSNLEMDSFDRALNQNDDIEDTSSLLNFNVVNTIISHLIMLLHVMIYSEFLPVFLGADVMIESLKFPFKIKGGFGFNKSKTGHLLSLNGVFGILSILFVLPFMIKKYESLKTYKMALFIFPICYFYLPEIIFSLPEYDASNPRYLHLLLLYLNMIMKEFAAVIAFSQIILLIHRAAPPQHRALVNGYSVSATCLVGIFAPLFWGWLMTTFDRMALSSIFWWSLSFVGLLGFAQCYLLRDY